MFQLAKTDAILFAENVVRMNALYADAAGLADTLNSSTAKGQ